MASSQLLQLRLVGHVNCSASTPLFLARKRISGSVLVGQRLSKHRPDIIKVVLHGSLVNNILSSSAYNADSHRFVLDHVVLHLTDIHQRREWTARSPNADGDIEIPFYFQIPGSFETTSADICHGSSSLDRMPWNAIPSSLHVPTSTSSDFSRHDSQAGSKVVYSIKAFALKRNEFLATASQSVWIFHSLPPTPPLCATDFPGDFTYRQEKHLTTLPFFQRAGNIIVSSAEPAPLDFCKLSSCELQTALPLHFEVLHRLANSTGTRDHGGGLLPPREEDLTLDVSITWHLKSLTFISVRKLACIPTLQQSCNTTMVSRIARLSSISRRKLRLSNWHRAPGFPTPGEQPDPDPMITTDRPPPLPPRPKYAAGSQQDRTMKKKNMTMMMMQSSHYHTSTSVLLTIPQEYQSNGRCQPPPPPTFSTPCLCRRYSFVVRLDISGPRWLGRARANLEVPVQVVYSSDAVGVGNYDDEEIPVEEHDDPLQREQSRRDSQAGSTVGRNNNNNNNNNNHDSDFAHVVWCDDDGDTIEEMPPVYVP